MGFDTLFDPYFIRQRATISGLKSVAHGVDSLRERQQEALNNVAARIGRTGEDIITVLRQEAQATRELMIIGTTSLVHELRLQTNLLTDIRDLISQPRTTASRERQKKGITFYNSGVDTGEHRWFREAIREFMAAIEKDDADAMSYWFLGDIYMLWEPDDARAEWAMSEVAFYTWPSEPHRSATALLSLATLAASNRNVQLAYKYAHTATGRDPAFSLAQFDLSRYAAQQDNCSEAAQLISIAIELDPTLFTPAVVDQHLSRCAAVESALRDRYTGLQRQGLAPLAKYEQQIRSAEALVSKLSLISHGDELQSLKSLVAEQQGQVRLYRKRVETEDYASLVTTVAEVSGADVAASKRFVGLLQSLCHTLRSKAKPEPPPKGRLTDYVTSDVISWVGVTVASVLAMSLIGPMITVVLSDMFDISDEARAPYDIWLVCGFLVAGLIFPSVWALVELHRRKRKNQPSPGERARLLKMAWLIENELARREGSGS